MFHLLTSRKHTIWRFAKNVTVTCVTGKHFLDIAEVESPNLLWRFIGEFWEKEVLLDLF